MPGHQSCCGCSCLPIRGTQHARSLAAPAAELGQDLVLSIWDQQWPALRATFSFCTGAISPRSLSGTPLDLQVIPPTALREARRLREASIVEPADLDAAHAPWLSIAVSDLSDSAGSAFREFLWRNAHGVVDHRELFASLAQLWFATADTQPSLIELLKTISEQHPGPSEGRALKRALFSKGAFLLDGLYPDANVVEALRSLASPQWAQAIDPDDIEWNEIALKAWRRDPEGTIALTQDLMRSDGGSPLSDPLLSALVEVMPLWDALQISKREPSLGVTLARRNPMFTQSPEAWQGRPDAQRELFAAVAGTGLSRDLQRGLVVAMLEAGSDAVAIEAVLAFGANAAQTVLSWFDMSDLSSPGDLLDGWRRALRDQTTVLLEWLEASASARESSVALIADLLDPRDAEVKARGAGLWLRPCRPSEVSLPKAAATSFRAFELALGLANAGSGSDELAVRSFEDVHKALRSDEVPYRAWLWIEEHVPTLVWWKNWDKCERVRRGLIASFVDRNWPVEQFVRCGRSEETLRELLGSCREIKKGSFILEKVREAITARRLSVTDATTRVLEEFV